jgi:hypothetical protein
MHGSAAAHGTTLQVCRRDVQDALAILDAPPLDENYVIED